MIGACPDPQVRSVSTRSGYKYPDGFSCELTGSSSASASRNITGRDVINASCAIGKLYSFANSVIASRKKILCPPCAKPEDLPMVLLLAVIHHQLLDDLPLSRCTSTDWSANPPTFSQLNCHK